MNTLGIYIHVPFCNKKCNYCDFFSAEKSSDAMDKYTEKVIDFIEENKDKYKDKTVDTIYFGGGTPSLLETHRIIKLLKSIKSNFSVSSDCEITLEANPATTDSLDLVALRQEGINRVSLGMQSIHKDELLCLGRSHKHEDVKIALRDLRNSGIHNISLDVMLGIPLQTMDSLRETLDFCVSENIPHISTYMLKIEKNTPFYKNPEGYIFADNDTQADLYEFTSEYLIKNGYRHYEISNFCKNDSLSKHNMKYWELKDYLGIGPSAHSMVNGERFYIPRNFEDFYNNIIVSDGKGKTAEEYLMLSLRTDKGFVFSDYEKMFGNKAPYELIKEALVLEKHGLIHADDKCIRLTEKGFLLSNTIILDLLSKGI